MWTNRLLWLQVFGEGTHLQSALGSACKVSAKGLGSLECEGGHAPAHDWQVTTPRNVLHARPRWGHMAATS